MILDISIRKAAADSINQLCSRKTPRVGEIAIYASIVSIAIACLSATALAGSFTQDIVAAAIDRTNRKIVYDGAYFSIAYPNGDVPSGIGVCTDVVVRSYRALGSDLQVLVHEDMKQHFDAYPSARIWGLNRPDPNIDHRRVPNLQVFFSRHGKTLPISERVEDYSPGDLVTWMLPGNLPHIGIVTDRLSPRSGRPLIVHNIGAGPQLEDMLFDYRITGHFRYEPN